MHNAVCTVEETAGKASTRTSDAIGKSLGVPMLQAPVSPCRVEKRTAIIGGTRSEKPFIQSLEKPPFTSKLHGCQLVPAGTPRVAWTVASFK